MLAVIIITIVSGLTANMHYSEESSQAFRSFSHYIKKGAHKQCTKSKLFDFHIIELGLKLSVSWWCGGLQKHLYSPDCL